MRAWSVVGAEPGYFSRDETNMERGFWRSANDQKDGSKDDGGGVRRKSGRSGRLLLSPKTTWKWRWRCEASPTAFQGPPQSS